MKNDILKNVKGTYDYYATELIVRNHIIDVLKNNFNLYGYLPLETPILSQYELLASKYSGGAEILKEVYRLNDQGDRELGLRYDLTIPFSKYIASQKELSLPIRRYEIGKVFRDGPVKAGRNREFYQCDVDVVGISSLLIEIEFFQMTNKVFKELGLDIEIHYNDRSFLTGLLTELGIPSNKVINVITSIDKLLKIGEEEVKKEINELDIDKSIIDKLFKVLYLDFLEIKDYFKTTTNEELIRGINNITLIEEYINNLNLNNCIFKPFLARGLDIYTGTVWEIVYPGFNSSLGGGGRYDKIITKFIDDGNNYPAVGMSFGLEPIYETLKNKLELNTNQIDVLIYSFEYNSYSLKIADELRTNNLKVIVEMNNWKLKKALDYSNKNNIPYVIIIGEDEIKTNTVSIKDMNNGKQVSVNNKEVINYLNNN